VTDPVVRLSGVAAGYRGRAVLTGVDLDVDRGELAVLVGPNGSGKSTLLAVLAGTVAPDAGTVEVLGRPMADWKRRELARVVSVLPQELTLPSGLRVAEVVALGRLPHARSAFGPDESDERVVAAALADADAADLALRPVTELSGGERQRVLLALALAQEPRVLLLDEPTLHLDVGHQLALLELLDRLRRTRDLTVVAVLHDLDLAARSADRVHLLHDGRLRPASAGDGSLDLERVGRAFGVPLMVARTDSGGTVVAIGRHESE
jgi:iron complex transport system ATP-binding protein